MLFSLLALTTLDALADGQDVFDLPYVRDDELTYTTSCDGSVTGNPTADHRMTWTPNPNDLAALQSAAVNGEVRVRVDVTQKFAGDESTSACSQYVLTIVTQAATIVQQGLTRCGTGSPLPTTDTHIVQLGPGSIGAVRVRLQAQGANGCSDESGAEMTNMVYTGELAEWLDTAQFTDFTAQTAAANPTSEFFTVSP